MASYDFSILSEQVSRSSASDSLKAPRQLCNHRMRKVKNSKEKVNNESSK